MKVSNPLSVLVVLAVFCFLVSCESNPETTVYSGEPELVEGIAEEYMEVEIEAEAVRPERPSTEVIRSMILADMLYEAQQAIDDNRLMYPSRDNAFDKYLEVLSVDQNNEVALQGIENIVDRYILLADRAVQVGQFDEAEQYLDRAIFINRDNEEIAKARQRIKVARENRDEIHLLDPEGVSDESLEVMTQLADIAEYIQTNDGRFLITARTDEEGRWIYRIMRQAVGGYRLRGNIATGSEPSVQISLPDNEFN